jgi:hypothetical protein
LISIPSFQTGFIRESDGSLADFDEMWRHPVQFFRAETWQILRKSALPSSDATGVICENSVECPKYYDLLVIKA